MSEGKHYLKNLFRMAAVIFRISPAHFLPVVIQNIAGTLLPYVNIIAIQMMVDRLTEKGTFSDVLPIIVVSLLLNAIFRLVIGICCKIREKTETLIELRFEQKLRFHVMGLPIYDAESNRVKELQRNADQAKMRNGGILNVARDAETIFRNLLALVTAGVVFARIFAMQDQGTEMSFWTSPIPVLILIAAVIAVTILTLGLQSKQNVKITRINDEVNQANGSAFAYMQFISDYHFGKDIRLYGLKNFLCDYFDKLWVTSIGYSLMKKYGKEKAKIPCTTTVFNGVLSIFVYALAIGKAYANEITVGNVVVYISSILAFIQGIVEVIRSFGEIIGHGGLMEPYIALLEIPEEEELEAKQGRRPLPDEEFKRLEFDHVYFKYPGQNEWLLEDVSFTLDDKTRLALVGENGAGKSTIIKLICRFYDVDKGTIRYNGVDIKEYDKKTYWSILGTVFQDFSLPALCIGNVIAAAGEYDDKKVEKVIDEVGLRGWLEKTGNDLDTYLYNDFGDEGVEISGGEGQKTAIARAVYKNARVMILDEPTAALDPLSEASIFNDLNNMCKDKACIFISHRLYSCRICDTILVLQNGKIIQKGTHEMLVRENGRYKEMWEAQAGMYKTA